MPKLAIITSHPIQYYAPWFRYLANTTGLNLRVFYLWDFGVTHQVDAGFQQTLQWDIPLLDGYEYEFVPNISPNPGTHSFWGLQNPSLLPQVYAYDPDAVLLMSYNYASLYRFIWSWNNRQKPLLFRGDSHCLVKQQGVKAGLRQKAISLIYQRIQAFLYVGKANYDYFRHHQVGSEQLFFAPHAVDNGRFFQQSQSSLYEAATWKQELGIPVNHAVILFAGKFESKTRPLDLLHAFLKANLPQVSLLFVGAGALESFLKNEATGHPNIHFVPFQNQSLMPRTYAIADLVVLPSYGGQETWGLVINEAMCLAKPVLVSSHVGCAEDLVHPHQNGLIFAAGDVAALTQSLREAFADPQRLHSWGEESRKIISNYSYTQTTQGLQQALEYFLNKAA